MILVEEEPPLERQGRERKTPVKSKNDMRTHDSFGRERTRTRTMRGTQTLRVTSHHTSLVT